MSDLEQRIRDVQHFGEEGGVVPVIDAAATSTFMNPKDMERAFHGDLSGCYLYSRHSNPTVSAFAKKLAAVEGMEAALGVASGMAAIATTLQQILRSGGHVVCSRSVYGGTYALLANVFPKMGIQTTFVDINDLAAVERAITPATKVLFTETLSNPLLAVSDLPAISKIAKARKIKFVVDNTFTPVLISPAQFGVDVVVYSCTKYISGSSDLIAGAVVSSLAFINELIDLNHGLVMLTGPVMDPRVAHELYLRLDHLPIRMKAHSASAHYLATRMSEEKLPVIYPGLESHPEKKLLEKMLNKGFGFGGMITLDCGTTERAMKLAYLLQMEKFGLYAVSLGFSRTLMSCPSVSTSSEIPEAEQKLMKLSPGLMRLSIGYTGSDKVMADRFFSCYAGSRS